MKSITETALDQIYKIMYDFDETDSESAPCLLALLGEVRGIAWLARELSKGEPKTDGLSEDSCDTGDYIIEP